MMQCQLCHDTGGPFEIIDYKNRCILVCEDCAKATWKYGDKAKIKKKRRHKNETANILHS